MKSKTKIFSNQQGRISKTVFETVAQEVNRGKLVVFPTETVYGIGALASNRRAIRKIYHLKGRSFKKPLSFHLGSTAQLKQIPFVRSRAFENLTKRFWPGPLTLIVQGKNGKTIGLRFPSHPVAQKLIAACKRPLLATSVNQSGEPSCTDGKRAKKQFLGKVDFVFDCGRTPLKQDSTIVDLSKKPYQILRRGPKVRAIEKLLNRI